MLSASPVRAHTRHSAASTFPVDADADAATTVLAASATHAGCTATLWCWSATGCRRLRHHVLTLPLPRWQLLPCSGSSRRRHRCTLCRRLCWPASRGGRRAVDHRTSLCHQRRRHLHLLVAVASLQHRPPTLHPLPLHVLLPAAASPLLPPFFALLDLHAQPPSNVRERLACHSRQSVVLVVSVEPQRCTPPFAPVAVSHCSVPVPTSVKSSRNR